MIDRNGSFTYSPVIRFHAGSPKPGLWVYPNPATNFLNIGGDLTAYPNLFILDAQGNRQRVADRMNNRVDIRNLPAGQYILECIGENGTRNLRFIKL
jgi:hypothetical protein